MRQTTSTIGRDKYVTRIHALTGSDIIADEPIDEGGQNLGPKPTELLAASLGACTCITIRMYADRKGWEVDEITAVVTYERDNQQAKSFFKKEITIKGAVDDAQITRMLEIGSKCPVHYTLTHPVEIETVLAQ